jgi:Mg2+-importing ATPase
MQILERLATPLNILLVVFASVSIAVGDNDAGLIILSMVVLSVSLAFVQERRSNRAADALTAMVHTTATVLRRAAAAESAAQEPVGLATAEIPLHLRVPGDIVHLSAGDMIPGDLRLISAKDLFVNQAALTGEALPVEKHADADSSTTGDSLELRNVCFMETTVVSGTAMGVIALTGARAYFGQLADLIAGDRAPTDFDRGISRFTWMMIRFILVMAPLLFLIND